MKKIIEVLRTKWAEYTVEIFVIVFGILIAFSLNTWNESRKLKQLETEALKEIRAGLMRLKGEIVFNIEDETDALTACTHILDNFTRNGGYTDSLGMSLTRAWVYTHIMVDMGSYEYVKNSGTTVITNPELRNDISMFYGVDIRATVSESEIRQSYIEGLKQMFSKWYETVMSNWYKWQPSSEIRT